MKLQKETKSDESQHGRWYGDACGAAFALELVGERWSLLIVRELVFGPRRFSDLRRLLAPISAKTLTERLERLISVGVARRCKIGPPASTQGYELTPWGQGLRGVLVGLCNWAVRSPDHDPGLGLTPSAWILSMEAMFQPRAAREQHFSLGFEVDDESFRVMIDDGEITNARGGLEGTDVAFIAPDARVLLRLFYGKAPLETVQREMGLVVSGDPELVAPVTALFRVPRGEFG